MKPGTTWQGEGVNLRLLTVKDLPMTLAWRNRDDARVQFRHAERLTPEAHRAWFAQEAHKTDSYMFIVEDALTHAPLGQVGIYHIDRVQQCAEVGRFIAAPEAEGKGRMTRGIEALCAWAEAVLHLQLLYLEVRQQNRRAIHVYEGCGFVPVAEQGSMLRMTRSAREFQG